MNKLFVFITFIIIATLIVGVTAYKVLDNHSAKLLLVEEKYLIETAKKCINDGNCTGEKITLQDLYDLNYLNKQANPVTKEYYNSESYIEKKDTNYTFVNVR